jgi:MFS family permease
MVAGETLNDDSRRLVALSVYHFVNDGSLAIFTSALPVMRVALALSYVEIGTILGAGLIATMALQLLFGVLSDRGHVRPILVLGFAGVVVADLVFTAGSTFQHVLLCYVSLRAAAAVYHPVGFASIGRTFVQNRTAAFGYQGAVGDLGLTLATFAAGGLSQAWGWEMPFWAWGAVGAVLLAFFVSIVARHGSAFHHEPIQRQSSAEQKGHEFGFSVPAFAALTTVSAVATVTFILFTSYMPLYFNVVAGLSPATSTAIVAIWIGIGVVAGLFTGRVVSSVGGEVKTLRLMLPIQAILFLAATLMMSSPGSTSLNGILLYLLTLATGIPVFVSFPATSGMLGSIMPHKRLGMTYALNLSLGLMVASGAAYVTGYLASLASIAVILPVLVVVSVFGAAGSFAVRHSRNASIR